MNKLFLIIFLLASSYSLYAMEFPAPNDQEVLDFLNSLPELELSAPSDPYQKLRNVIICADIPQPALKRVKKPHFLEVVPEHEKPFKCSYFPCTRAFLSDNLDAHILKAHLHKKPCYCKHPGCGKYFAHKSYLRRHTINKHLIKEN